MSRLVLCLLLLTMNSNILFSQCPTWPNIDDCFYGLNAQGGVCNSSTIFCVGDSVGVQNISVGIVDSSFICWDDGTVQSFAGIFQGCIKHYYNYTPDSCVGGSGQIQKLIQIGIKRGCTAGQNFHYILTPIAIKFRPKADFVATPMVVCVNQPVSIINNSCPNSNSPINYWDFGDGTNSTTQNPGSHTYNIPGTYAITYSLTNSCGTSTHSETITVLPPTIIQPVITLADQCTPAQFVPDVNSQNVLTFLWTSNPTSGISITLPVDSQPDFNVTNSGNYNINLQVTGCCSSINSICQWDTSLTFYQGPNLNLTPIPTYCNSATISPTNFISISGTISQYNWQFPGGSPSSSNSANPGNIFYSTPGIYPLTLIVNSPCGTDSIVDTVRILPPTTISPIVTVNGNCAPLTIDGNLNAFNGTSYNWSLNPGSIGTVQTPNAVQTIIDINSAGTFTISASANGCCSAPQSICNWDTTLTLVQGPALTSSAIPAICNSGSINPSNYISISGSVSSYSWNFNGGVPNSSTNANPGTINYGSPGNYSITLAVTGSCGTDSISENFIVGSPPLLNVQSTSLFGCDTLTIDFINTSPANQNYNWTANGGIFTNGTSSMSEEPSIFFGSPGIYQIEVSASTPGCNPVSQTFNIEIGEAPDLSIIATIDDICDSTYLNLSDFFALIPSTSDSGYAWNIFFNSTNYFSYSGTNPTSVFIQDTGIYIVNVLAWNACDSIILTDTFSFYFPPSLIIPPDTTVCKGSGPISLIANPATGNWSWNGNVISTGFFNTSLTNQEQNYLVYTFGILTCEVRDSFLVTVIGANINAGNDTVLCSNSSPFTLNGIPTPGVWTGEGVVDSLTGYYDPSLTTISPDVVVYTYYEPISGCVIPDTVLITVFQPTGGGFIMPDTACINQPITFSDTIPNTTAYWDFGDGSGLIAANTITHTYTSPGMYNVMLIIENIYGCKDTVFNSIEIAEPPDASFMLDVQNGCAILPVTITNQSTLYGGSTYTWDYGNGVTDTLFNPGLIYFDQGAGDSTIYNIQLVVTNGCGVASFLDSIVVYPIPVPEFGVIFSDSCSPALVMFNNITTGNPQTYQWYINGVFVSSDSILPPQIFLADSTDSTYVVMLVASNFCGQDTILKNVVIHPNQVTAFFNTDIVYGCKPLQVTFTSFVAANSVIQWDFGDGTYGSGNTVTHIFDSAGVFTVWQFVDNYCGFDSVSQTIEVLEQPELSFSIPEKQCNNVPVTFLNTSLNISGVLWDFGDGSPLDSISNSPIHLYTAPGIYNVTMIGFASVSGCSDTISATIEIVDHPLASFSLSPIDGCIPLTVNLLSNSVGAAYYSWSMGNGDTIIGSQPMYVYTQAGQFTVSLIATDNNGCQDDTSFSYINVYPIPESIFEYVQDPMCEIPTSVNFTNSSSGASAYIWNFGIYGSSNQQNPSLPFSLPANFNASLIAQNIFGCSDTSSKLIKVYAKPLAAYAPDSISGCPPLEVVFENLSEFYNQVYWDFGDGIISSEVSPTHIYENPGTYSTSLIIGMDSLCYDTVSYSNSVFVSEKPTSNFTIQEVTDTLINPSGIYSFIDNSIDAVSWFWSFGDGAFSILQNPTHRYYSNGIMYVTLIVKNELGCLDTSFQIINVDFLGSLFIPNAFSPDAGTIETMYFIPKGVGIQEYLIEIFSPYGEKVWSSTKLDNGQPAEKWDGTLNGKPLPQGAYVWKAYALFGNGKIWEGMKFEDKKPTKVGSVTILR